MFISKAPEKGWYIILTVNNTIYKGEFKMMQKKYGGFNFPMELIFDNAQMFSTPKNKWQNTRYTWIITSTKIQKLIKKDSEPYDVSNIIRNS